MSVASATLHAKFVMKDLASYPECKHSRIAVLDHPGSVPFISNESSSLAKNASIQATMGVNIINTDIRTSPFRLPASGMTLENLARLPSYPSMRLSSPLSCIRLFFCCCISLLLLPALSFGQGVAAFADTPDFTTPSIINVLEDSSGQWEIDNVRQLPGDHFRRVPTHGNEINLGISRSTFWLRFLINSPEQPKARDWLLEVANPLLDRVEVYAPDAPAMVSGDQTPFLARPFHDKHLVFPLHLPDEFAHTIYMRVSTKGAFTIPIYLWRPDAFARQSRNEYALLTFYFGVLLSLALAGLVLAAVLRERLHLLYASMVACIGITLFSFNGLANQYLWPNSPLLCERLFLVGTCGMGISAALLSRDFMHLQHKAPRLDLVMKVFLAALALLVLLALLDFYRLVARVLPPLLVALTLFIMAAILWHRARGHQTSYWFGLAWPGMILVMLIGSARLYGFVSVKQFTMYALPFSVALELLVFTFAIAHRLRQSRQSEEQATVQLAAAQLQQRFIAVFSHEIRNPVAGIVAATANLLRSNGTHLPDTVHKRHLTIHQLAQRLHFLVSNHLTDEHLQSDQFRPHMSRLDVRSVVTESVHEQVLESKRISHKEDGTPQWIHGDGRLLLLAFNNLIDNALKYSARDRRVEIAIVPRDHRVEIRIRDHGIGISPQHIDHLFTPFFRSERTASIHGCGLGLWIVKRIIELHRGRIDVASTPDQGTTFTVSLPLAPPADASAEPGHARPDSRPGVSVKQPVGLA